MKLKDIIPGNYYLTKGNTYSQPAPIKVLEFVKEKTFGGPWSTRADGTITKIKIASLRVDDEGSMIETEVYIAMVPGRIQSEISAEKVVSIFATRYEQRQKILNENKAADAGGAAFLRALSAAGFTGAHQNYKGIAFSNAVIADWLRANNPAS